MYFRSVQLRCSYRSFKLINERESACDWNMTFLNLNGERWLIEVFCLILYTYFANIQKLHKTLYIRPAGVRIYIFSVVRVYMKWVLPTKNHRSGIKFVSNLHYNSILNGHMKWMWHMWIKWQTNEEREWWKNCGMCMIILNKVSGVNAFWPIFCQL